jgi:GxxExxY protein
LGFAMKTHQSFKSRFQGKHSDLTEKIIGVFYDVYNELGYGFSERVYENSIVIRLEDIDLSVKQQAPIKVHFDNRVVGEYH